MPGLVERIVAHLVPNRVPAAIPVQAGGEITPIPMDTVGRRLKGTHSVGPMAVAGIYTAVILLAQADNPGASRLRMATSAFSLCFADDVGFEHRMLVRQVVPESPSRPAVILLHFASGHSGRMVPLAFELALRGYPVFAPDLLGHGASSKGRPVFDDTLAGLDRLLERIAASEGPGPIGVVGSSMGGEIAVFLALAEAVREQSGGPPSRIGGAVTQGLHTPWQREVSWRFSVPTLWLLASDPLPPLVVSPPVVPSDWMFPPRKIYGERTLRRDFRADPARKRVFPGRVVVKATRYRPQLPPNPVATPLLVIHGGADRLVRDRYAQRMHAALARRFANTELVLVPDATHGMFEELAELSGSLVDDWFRATLSPKPTMEGD